MPAFARALFRPSTWRPAIAAAKILWYDYAHLKSAAAGRPMDAGGNPVPWYTYPAIEYLRQLDFGDSSVFEYGSGQSTLFWAAKAARVVSVEDDENWHAALAGRVPDNCELILEPDLSIYPDVIHRYREFDLIVVDGAARGRTRLKCSHAAVSHLRPGGLIILDNSDWLPASARFLRESGLLQVDMTGLAPGNANTQTTSLFFRRDFVPRPRFDRLPLPGAGAADKNWERLRTPEEPSVTIGGDALGAVETDRCTTFDTPEGRRTLRVIEGRAQGRRWSALADADRDRVILYLTDEEGAGEISPTVEAAEADWPTVVDYVRKHPRRRCLL